MKLYRSDLENSISNQLFEISTEEFELDSIIFAEKMIFCKSPYRVPHTKFLA